MRAQLRQPGRQWREQFENASLSLRKGKQDYPVSPRAIPGSFYLDIWLKDSSMDGIDILKLVKRDHPDVPVVKL